MMEIIHEFIFANSSVADVCVENSSDDSQPSDTEMERSYNNLTHIFHILRYGLAYLKDNPIFIDTAWTGFFSMGIHYPDSNISKGYLEKTLEYMRKAGIDDDRLMSLAIAMGEKYALFERIENYDGQVIDSDIQCKIEEERFVITVSLVLTDSSKVNLEPLIVDIPPLETPPRVAGAV